jgi:transcriptional regulator with XRE-family HTH domain
MLLGKRVHELRAAKKWSQEEFAHISGLHRTYIGQIERGEKNISFGNLSKIASVLGVTLSELLFRLEDGGALSKKSEQAQRAGGPTSPETTLRMFEIRQLVRRLALQRTAMDRTIKTLEELAVRSPQTRRLASRTLLKK